MKNITKKIVFIIAFITCVISVNAQNYYPYNTFTFNVGYSSKNCVNIGMHYIDKKDFIYTFVGGVNCKTGFIGKDYTNIIGINTWPEDQYETKNSDVFNINIGIGHRIFDNLYLSGIIGCGYNQTAINSYDNSHILSSNGYYYFKTESKGNVNVGIYANYFFNKINIGIGYDIINGVSGMIGINFQL